MAITAIQRFEGITRATSLADPSLAEDVIRGLRTAPQPTLPARLLYDDHGSELFDRICDLPEYYPTRTEQALLEKVAFDIAFRTGARVLVELGSGMARRTHLLLDALAARHSEALRYIPFDISAGTVQTSIYRLLRRYPRLRARGVIGDFTRHLSAIPEGERRLIAFLGGTFGNLSPDEAGMFLAQLTALLGPDDYFLLAADLIKDRHVLHDAYNDTAGVTAAFNLNVLQRLRVDLGIDIDCGVFRHDAFFNEEASQIEMHARARADTCLSSARFDFRRVCDAGDSIRTEISRKFSIDGLTEVLISAGMQVSAVYRSAPPYALVLARRCVSARLN